MQWYISSVSTFGKNCSWKRSLEITLYTVYFRHAAFEVGLGFLRFRIKNDPWAVLYLSILQQSRETSSVEGSPSSPSDSLSELLSFPGVESLEVSGQGLKWSFSFEKALWLSSVVFLSFVVVFDGIPETRRNNGMALVNSLQLTFFFAI